MPGVKKEIKEPKLLFVEGTDEEHFFNKMIDVFKIKEIQAIEMGGKDSFLKKIEAFIATPEYTEIKAYAVIRDADVNKDDTLKSVKGTLKRFKQPCPDKSGEIVTGENSKVEGHSLKVGIFIIPYDKKSGMLEDLCYEIISEMGHPAVECVDEYVKCISSKLKRSVPKNKMIKGKFYAPKNMAKAKMRALLAAMPEDVKNIGIAAEKTYFDFKSPQLKTLVDFIKKI